MRASRTVGPLALLAALAAAGSAAADPILSDRVIITDDAGKVILDVTRNEGPEDLPEPGISSGPLKAPHSPRNVEANFVLTDKDDPDFNSDWMRLRVVGRRDFDILLFVFMSNRYGRPLHLPGDFPADSPRLAETGELRDVTALLFPRWAAAGKAAPFTVQVQSDLDAAKDGSDHAPEPASLTLLALGAAAVGAHAWRRRRPGPR